MFPDYLRHAECIKERSTAPDFCGPHYNRLVEQVHITNPFIIIVVIINIFMIIVMTTQTLTQVKGSRPASQRDMCCTHSSFKVLNLLLLPLITIIIISSVVIISSSSYKSRIIKTMKKFIKLSTQHNPNNHHQNLAIKILIITAKCL